MTIPLSTVEKRLDFHQGRREMVETMCLWHSLP